MPAAAVDFNCQLLFLDPSIQSIVAHPFFTILRVGSPHFNVVLLAIPFEELEGHLTLVVRIVVSFFRNNPNMVCLEMIHSEVLHAGRSNCHSFPKNIQAVGDLQKFVTEGNERSHQDLHIVGTIRC
ncbi:unnamed protein product [Meloidogyne enterolobii]|uniref:Uncharacterized protein n=1 Tax=Meloidogyne enterolobii TaxID=390850 RepID=A0ACB1AFW0_MELEN